MSEITEKPLFNLLSDVQFRHNIITIGLDGKQTQLEYLVLNDRQGIGTDDAIELAKKSEVDGGGWELIPGPHEALPLFVYNDAESPVHPELREMLKYDGWKLLTAQIDLSGSGCAFCVDLDYGNVRWYSRRSNGLAVACRRVSPHQ